MSDDITTFCAAWIAKAADAQGNCATVFAQLPANLSIL